MLKEDLLYIEDGNGHQLAYQFTPASMASNFVPLVVVLGDKEGAEAKEFEYKMWNILRPVVEFGYEYRGSFSSGEKGDSFVKDLLQTLIRQISEEHDCEEHIYLYGSGRGGYAAILQGVLCKANAVYAHTSGMRLSDNDTDLSSVLNAADTFPVFYLCDDAGPADDKAERFTEAFKKHDIAFHLALCPEPGADEEQTLKKVLDMFERVSPDMKS